MKILVCDKTEAEAVERMRAAGLQVDVRDDITPEELVKVLPAYDGMVVRSRTKVRQPLIDAAPKLKVIVRGGVGLDTIDAEYARSKGITVMNTPKASSASVAELAIGFMFALARSICVATASMKAGKWEKKKFEGDELAGKTLGILGAGNIGKEVAKRAAALGMNVLACDTLVQNCEGADLTGLDDLLSALGLHHPAPAQDERNDEYDRQRSIRDDEDRRAADQLRAGRDRGRRGAVRCAGERQSGGSSPGCICSRTERRAPPVLAGECDRLAAHRRGHQRGPGAGWR